MDCVIRQNSRASWDSRLTNSRACFRRVLFEPSLTRVRLMDFSDPGKAPELSDLLRHPLPTYLTFDDAHEAGQSKPEGGTPVDVVEMFKRGIGNLDEYAAALSAVLATHPEELRELRESETPGRFALVVDTLVSNVLGSND